MILNIIEGPKEESFRVNGRIYDHERIDAVLPLGKAEEWRAIALIDDHPLHIHVNPFQIISIEDPAGPRRHRPQGPGFRPGLCRTEGRVEGHGVIKKNVRVAFRTRYERFTGDFVTHCHIMYHGDHGMMQNLRIAADDKSLAPHASH